MSDKKYTYDYPMFAVCVDILVLGWVKGEKAPYGLLIRRGGEPHKGKLAMPGGFVNIDETTHDAAIRELKEETGLKVDKELLIQTHVADKVDRDPRQRTMAVGYVTEIFVDSVEELPEVKGMDDAAYAAWFLLTKNNMTDQLAFDHFEFIPILMNKYEYIMTGTEQMMVREMLRPQLDKIIEEVKEELNNPLGLPKEDEEDE